MHGPACLETAAVHEKSDSLTHKCLIYTLDVTLVKQCIKRCITIRYNITVLYITSYPVVPKVGDTALGDRCNDSDGKNDLRCKWRRLNKNKRAVKEYIKEEDNYEKPFINIASVT